MRETFALKYHESDVRSKDCKVVESHVSEHIEHVGEDELSDKTITGCHKSPTCSIALGNLLQSFEYIFISLPNA